MQKCQGCGKERRVDRMSCHILEEHKENVLALSKNKKALEETIKFKEGTTRISLSNPADKTEISYYTVSFGFNSGWKDVITKKGKEKIQEHKEEHLKKCRELLDEFQPFPVLCVESEDYERLHVKYLALQEKVGRLESEKRKKDEEDSNLQKIKKLEESLKQKERFIKELSNQIEEHQSSVEIIGRFYPVDEIVERVASVYADYSGDERDDELEKIKPIDEEEEKRKKEQALQRKREEDRKFIEEQTKTYGDDFTY
jgi:hypothetical protein